MVLHLLNMRMEVMGGIAGTPGVGDEAEDAISVVMGGEGTTVHRRMLSVTMKASIKNHQFEVLSSYILFDILL